MSDRQKFNGYLEPDWDAPENRYPIRCIVTNLFATSQIGATHCSFCGNEFERIPQTQREAATLCRHGSGCVWAEALRLFGMTVNQK